MNKTMPLIDLPEGTVTYDTIEPFLPVHKSRAQLLYLSRAGKFPPYIKVLGNASPALWRKADLLAFWEEKFLEGWPHKVAAMRKAFKKPAKQKPITKCGVGDPHAK